MPIDSKKNLVVYFKKNLLKGYTAEALKIALINQGYSRITIEEALKQANQEIAAKAPVIKEKPVIKYEIVGEDDTPISIKKPWWRKFFS